MHFILYLNSVFSAEYRAPGAHGPRKIRCTSGYARIKANTGGGGGTNTLHGTGVPEEGGDVGYLLCDELSHEGSARVLFHLHRDASVSYSVAALEIDAGRDA